FLWQSDPVIEDTHHEKSGNQAELSKPDENSSFRRSKRPRPSPPKKSLLGPGRSAAQRRFLARLGRDGVRVQGVGQRSLLFSGWHLSDFATLFQPIALAANVYHRRVLQQPVQNRSGYDRV